MESAMEVAREVREVVLARREIGAVEGSEERVRRRGDEGRSAEDLRKRSIAWLLLWLEMGVRVVLDVEG